VENEKSLERLLLSLTDEPPDIAREMFMQDIKDEPINYLLSVITSPKAEDGKRKIIQDIIKKYELEYPFFISVTQMTAKELITANGYETGTEKFDGYSSYIGLAKFLCGKDLNFKQTGEYFRKLAEANDMPDLTEEHHAYLRDFNLAYIQKTSKSKLEEHISFGSGISLDPKNKQYSMFLHKLSDKICQDKEMQKIFYEKWSGVKTLEQVKRKSVGRIIGYEHLKSLATFLSGKNISGNAEAGKYFRSLFEPTS